MNLTQENVSNILGVSPCTVANWEHDKFRPVGKNLRLLIKLLKVNRNEVYNYFNYEIISSDYFNGE